MILKTDHSFHIGEQHLRNGKPCQDYALSGMLNADLAYAIVSDGCSSGGMTDIGARLMALATKRALVELVKTPDFPQSDNDVQAVNLLRDSYLEAYRVSLDLDYRDLLATCLWAVASPQTAYYHVTGDGVVVVRYRNCWAVNTFEWAKNMPYYPIYRLCDTQADYLSAQANIDKPFNRTITGSHGDGIDIVFSETFDAADSMRGLGFAPELENKTGPGPLTHIALFSDGVQQVDAIDTFGVSSSLTQFKSTQGQFAVRRMNRFLRDAKKIGRGPIDDIAYAVINFDHEDEERRA